MIWWDHLAQIDPQYGYYLNAPKIWLIVKEELLSPAKTIFGTSVSTKEGKGTWKVPVVGLRKLNIAHTAAANDLYGTLTYIYYSLALITCYRQNKQEKRRAHDQ